MKCRRRSEMASFYFGLIRIIFLRSILFITIVFKTNSNSRFKTINSRKTYFYFLKGLTNFSRQSLDEVKVMWDTSVLWGSWGGLSSCSPASLVKWKLDGNTFKSGEESKSVAFTKSADVFCSSERFRGLRGGLWSFGFWTSNSFNLISNSSVAIELLVVPLDEDLFNLEIICRDIACWLLDFFATPWCFTLISSLDSFALLLVCLSPDKEDEAVEVVVVDKIPSDSGDLVETKSCFCFRLASSCASSRFLCSS